MGIDARLLLFQRLHGQVHRHDLSGLARRAPVSPLFPLLLLSFSSLLHLSFPSLPIPFLHLLFFLPFLLPLLSPLPSPPLSSSLSSLPPSPPPSLFFFLLFFLLFFFLSFFILSFFFFYCLFFLFSFFFSVVLCPG
ncbi:hypothetical protein, partial [Bordetella pseudohinzii]|uniref:hypothetical protein n=1 Tax=Bordetella pseudohinzii TaxID=1331258 RepID=UPI001F413126